MVQVVKAEDIVDGDMDGDLQINEDQEDADVVMDAHSKLKAPLSCGLGHQKGTYKHWTKVQC